MSWPLSVPLPPQEAGLSSHQRLLWRQQMLQQQSAALRSELASQGTAVWSDTRTHYAGAFRRAGLALRWGLKVQAWWREAEQTGQLSGWMGMAGAGWIGLRLLKRRRRHRANPDRLAAGPGPREPGVVRLLHWARWARRGMLLWRVWRSVQGLSAAGNAVAAPPVPSSRLP